MYHGRLTKFVRESVSASRAGGAGVVLGIGSIQQQFSADNGNFHRVSA